MQAAAKRAKREAQPAVNAAMRCAQRAAERALHVGSSKEVGVLREQVFQIHNDKDLATKDEYTVITARLNELAQHRARKEEHKLAHELQAQLLQARKEEQKLQDECNEKQLHDDCVRRSCKEKDLELVKETNKERVSFENLMADFVADGAKKTGVFDCGVCLEEKPLARMRMLNCGHVFCAGCVAVLKEANRTRDVGQEAKGCPKCRCPIAAVLKPYF
jgi:hypothetical protein